MKLSERVAYLLKQAGRGEGGAALPGAQCVGELDSAALTEEELLALAAQLHCPADYLRGRAPFAEPVFLQENREEISVHLKLILLINKRKPDVLETMDFAGYLWILDEFVSNVEPRDGGIDVTYR